jgi:UPF0176 protein
MMSENNNIAITSFYSFIDIEDIISLQPRILLVAKKKYVKGTILLAREGFNGSLSGAKENVEFVVSELIKLTGATDVNFKTNYSSVHPFSKMKVKLKKEIVTLGLGEIDVNSLKGEHIEPTEWDEFISSEDVITIDTRNDYEYAMGHFEGAVDPLTPTFRDFPMWAEEHKHMLEGKKIAMYCTGGIRCEKSTAYMRSLGYKEVYHLKGGILQYLEDTNNKNGKWHGECFVFDDRRAVDSDLKPSESALAENRELDCQ